MKNPLKDSRFISGLHNYCDRWCERCALTSRCRSFAISNEKFPDQDSGDPGNDAFWKKLSEMLKETVDILNHAAKQEGIDLASIDSDMDCEDEKVAEEIVRNHACCRMAGIYAEMVDSWFDFAEDMFEEDEDRPGFTPGFQWPNLRTMDSEGLEEAVQVIRWYQHQIYIKLMRAVRGSMEEMPAGSDDFARDSDGSAKVALIAMDRSIAAWGKLRSHYPFNDEKLKEILLQLSRLRKKTEEVFPDARSFIRPGFDRIEMNS